MRPHALAFIAVGLIGLLGCEELPEDTSQSTQTESTCPQGLSDARSSGMTVVSFILDDITVITNYDSQATYSEVPSACVNNMTGEAEWIFEVTGEPYGRVSLDADEAGSFDLNGADTTLTIELFGAADPVTFSNGDWVSGSAWIDTAQTPVSFGVNGVAMTSDRKLQISLMAEAQ